MRRFKEGDKVIVARITNKSAKGKEDDVGTVSVVTCASYTATSYPYSLQGLDWVWSEEGIEGEEFYNSPLYQALL